MTLKDNKLAAVQAYIDGMPIKEISETYVIGLGVLYYELDKAGIPRRQKHPNRRSGRHWKTKRRRRRAVRAVNRALNEEYADIWQH